MRLSIAAEQTADERQVTEYGHLVFHLLHFILNHTTDGDGVAIIHAGVGVDDEGKFDDDEFLLPEEMIGNIKDIIFKRNL